MSSYSLIFILNVGESVGAPGDHPWPSASSSSHTGESQNQSTSNGTLCNSDIDNFVYHPSRLKVIQECITATGTLDLARVEKDGDYHMLVKLDPPCANLTNS